MTTTYTAHPGGAPGHPVATTTPPLNKGGSPAKMLVIVLVVLALLGGGALLVTQIVSDDRTDTVPNTITNPTISDIATPEPVNSGTRPSGFLAEVSQVADAPDVFAQASPSPGRPSPSPTRSPAPTTTSRGGTTTTTTRQQQQGGATSEILGGVTVATPPGWKVVVAKEGRVVLEKAGGLFWTEGVFLEGDVPADRLVGSVQGFVAENFVQEMEVSEIESLQPPKANIISMAGSQYRGLWTTQQGSAPVEGVIYGIVRQDGLAIILFTVNGRDQFDKSKNDYNAMISSILQSM